jgi:hypothetical protein
MRSVRWILIFVLACNILLCVGGLSAIFFLPSPDSPSAANAKTLRIGVSPEKEALFRRLVDGFNASGTPHRVEGVRVEPDDLVDAATSGKFGAVSPDSAVWLDQIDRSWQSANADAAPLTSSLTRYAVSPIVIAMWERVGRDLGHPQRPIGWSTVMDRALRDQNFRWSHS